MARGLLSRALSPRHRGHAGAVKPFQRILSHEDWWKDELETGTDIINCPAGKWTRIGQFTIPPQQRIYFGYGTPEHWQNQGYMHIALYDATLPDSRIAEGVIRLRQMNANETQIKVVYEGRTENLRGDVNDKMKMIPLPFAGDTPKELTVEDCKLTIEFMADVAVALVQTAAGASAGLDIWNVPVSVFEV